MSLITEELINCPVCKSEQPATIYISTAISEAWCYKCKTHLVRNDCDGEKKWKG